MPGYIAEALRKEREALDARQSLRQDFIADIGESFSSSYLMDATRKLGYVPPDVHNEALERLEIAYDAGAITGNDQYDIRTAVNSAVNHYVDLDKARLASGMTPLAQEFPAHTENRAEFLSHLKGNLPLGLYEELGQEQSWARMVESAPTIRALAIENYDLESPAHKQRLEICDEYRAKLEKGYGATDSDSYITRGEYREAIGFTGQIRDAVADGKSISHEDLSRSVYEPGVSGYDWSDRAVAEGASSKIDTLITKLEATGYRFIEPPEGIPSEKLLQQARSVDLPAGWSWEEKQYATGKPGFILHNEYGESMATAGPQPFDNGYSHSAGGGPFMDTMHVNSIDDAKALALYAGVQYANLDPETRLSGRIAWEDPRLADVPTRAEVNRTYAQLDTMQQLDVVGSHFRQLIAEKGYEVGGRIPDQVYIEAAEYAKTINPEYSNVANYIAGDCINATHSTDYGADVGRQTIESLHAQYEELLPKLEASAPGSQERLGFQQELNRLVVAETELQLASSPDMAIQSRIESPSADISWG
jgi:hypothetical protein